MGRTTGIPGISRCARCLNRVRRVKKMLYNYLAHPSYFLALRKVFIRNLSHSVNNLEDKGRFYAEVKNISQQHNFLIIVFEEKFRQNRGTEKKPIKDVLGCSERGRFHSSFKSAQKPILHFRF